MTSLTLHTPATNANIILTMPSASSKKRVSTNRNYVTYSVSAKNMWSKPALKLPLIDWDLNMNELEFE